MALGCHGGMKVLLGKQRKGNGFRLGRNWLAWLVQVYARDRVVMIDRCTWVCGSRPSHLRTGL